MESVWPGSRHSSPGITILSSLFALFFLRNVREKTSIRGKFGRLMRKLRPRAAYRLGERLAIHTLQTFAFRSPIRQVSPAAGSHVFGLHAKKLRRSHKIKIRQNAGGHSAGPCDYWLFPGFTAGEVFAESPAYCWYRWPGPQKPVRTRRSKPASTRSSCTEARSRILVCYFSRRG